MTMQTLLHASLRCVPGQLVLSDLLLLKDQQRHLMGMLSVDDGVTAVNRA